MINLVEARALVQYITTKGRVAFPFHVTSEMEMVLDAITFMKKVMHEMQEEIVKFERLKKLNGEVSYRRMLKAERKMKKNSWVKCNTRMPKVKEPEMFFVKLIDGTVTTDRIVFNDAGRRVWDKFGFQVVKWANIPVDDEPKKVEEKKEEA